jgi:hypothetical protein
MKNTMWKSSGSDRRTFIGGSDARVVMGSDEQALIRLWREKRGEIEPEDLSGNLVVQLGLATEALNRRWYEANTGQVVTDIQKRVRHPALRWMGATLDGRVEGSDAVFEAKFMLPWSFSEEMAAEKYMPQLQHNMWVVAARSAVLSVITGGGKWVEILAHADPLYQHLIPDISSRRIVKWPDKIEDTLRKNGIRYEFDEVRNASLMDLEKDDSKFFLDFGQPQIAEYSPFVVPSFVGEYGYYHIDVEAQTPERGRIESRLAYTSLMPSGRFL